MNETLKSILNRRSIRKYKENQIKDEELKSIIEAGKFAPSGMNQQPWHFTVIQNKEILQKLDIACKEVLKNSGNNLQEIAAHENFNVLYNAPTLIIVSGNPKSFTYQSDCSLALENMFIAAESLNIGSCWIHAMSFLFSTESGKALKKELGIPKGFIVVGSSSFGYKDIDQPSPKPRNDDTVNIIR